MHTTTLVKKPINKKLAAAAFAGMLAVGAFSAAPAFAGSGTNGCSAAGCGKKTEKSSCKASHGCKGKTSCKAKHSCKDKTSCKAKADCKGKTSCKTKSGSTCTGDHNDGSRYND